MGDSWLIGCNLSLPLLFSSLPMRKSCEIRLEEFRYRDPWWAIARKGRLPAANPVASRDDGAGASCKGGRPSVEWLPVIRGRRHQRRGDDGGTVKANEKR
ncbi:hypothetical protein BHM03_00055161 [Ensete ventricosum]|nr:hypothetical protein BHM03_00055161 [Ensete ventricosum]